MMSKSIRALLATFYFILNCSLGHAEEAVVSAVKQHLAADGATIEEVLKYAERMRPEKFKVEKFEVNDQQNFVSVAYWVGAKRLEGDAFSDLTFEVSKAGAAFTVTPYANDYNKKRGGGPADALQGGRDRFLLYVDSTYEDDCVDIDTQAKSC